MAFRRLKLGPVDMLFSYPDGLGRKVRTLGGLLGSGGVAENGAAPPLEEREVEDKELQQRVNGIEWYHTIDLPGGVVTPGWFDLRDLLHHYPIPQSLEGKRVLDVASFDGFWAREFERRGAAEVIALDIESFSDVDMNPRVRRTKSPEYLAFKTGEGFELASQVLGSKVKREICNVYDLSPERLGTFDMVFISDVLLHLMRPMQALINIAGVTRPDGCAVIADVYNERLPDTLMRYESGNNHNEWWSIGFGALEQMIWDAGFSSVELKNKFYTGYRGQKAILPHAAFVARP